MSRDLVFAILARTNANIMVLTAADRSLSPELASPARVELIFVLFATQHRKQGLFIQGMGRSLGEGLSHARQRVSALGANVPQFNGQFRRW